jgi:hypothetical protein
MKADELRIGNYVYNGGIESSVAYLLPNDIICNVADFNGSLNGEVTPIPLTEEWLLKFGFGKDDFCGAYVRYDSNRLSITHDVKNNTFLADIVKYLRVFTRYVHQLQNLYFALTGEELTIKETP